MQIEKKKGLQGLYHVECHDKAGNLKWAEDAPNACFNEGEESILEVYFRNTGHPGTFYLGLLKDTLVGLPVETTTLFTEGFIDNEPINATSPGYAARGTIARSAVGWPTSADDGGDWKVTSLSIVFTATGDWAAPIRWLFLTTTSATPGDTTGILISITQLSADRTLLDGDTLTITYSVKLQ